MDVVYAIILGVVQGVAEFLPISSSGHLVFFHEFLNFNLISDLSFDVFLHWGTFLALFVFFFKDIVRYVKAIFQKGNPDKKVAWFIVLATIPAVIAGYFLNDIIESSLRQVWLVVAMLILFAIVFFFVEKFAKKTQNLDKLNWWQALIIGVFQAISLVPGVSRSGATISAGMIFNLNRKEAARFSFLLSLPVIFGAGIKQLFDITLDKNDFGLYLVGFFVAAVIGYFCVKYFLKYLEKYSLKPFAWYRIVLALLIIIFIVL